MRIIKISLPYLLTLCLLLTLTGCKNEQDDIYSEAMTKSADASESQGPFPEAGETGERKLVIKTPFSNDGTGALPYLAKEFMDLHPGVVIEIDSAISNSQILSMSRAEIQMARESFYSRVSMEIASGEADYALFDVRDGLNIPQLTRNGFLEDLLPLWEADPALSSDGYFTNVLSGFKVDGKLSTLPYSFSFYDLYLNRDILERLGVDPETIEAVDPNRVLDWYERGRELQSNLNLSFSSGGKGLFYEYLERCHYIDLAERTASFDSPEFIDFLTRTNDVLNEDPDLEPELLGYGGCGGLLDANISYRKTGEYSEDILAWSPEVFKTVVEKARPGFLVLEESFVPNLITMQQPKEYAAGPYPLLTTDGKLGVRSVEEFSLPSAMKDKELAWEFIKHCLGTRSVERLDFLAQGSPVKYTTFIPVNKATFQNMLEDVNQHGDHGLAMGYSGFDTIDPKSMTELLEEILDREMVNIDLYSVDMEEFLEEFYVSGLTTPEECARKMQDRAYIWLNE